MVVAVEAAGIDNHRNKFALVGSKVTDLAEEIHTVLEQVMDNERTLNHRLPPEEFQSKHALVSPGCNLEMLCNQ